MIVLGRAEFYITENRPELNAVGSRFSKLSMSVAGQCRPNRAVYSMSAFLPLATKLQTSLMVRLVPTSDSCTATKNGLLNHVVRGCEHGCGHLDVELLSSFEINYQLEFGRLNDWQLGGLFSLEDLAGIRADLTKRVCKV